MSAFKHVAFFSFFLLISIAVGFYIGGYFKSEQGEHLEASHHDFHEMLDLTDDQLEKLVPIEKEFAKKKAYYKNKIRSANMELGDIMQKEKSFTPEVQAAVEKVHAAMGELQKITLIHFFDMRDLLDEKQVQVFDDYVADVMYGL
tara:strand:- start:22187 stop:22621 length:435 start_codon:yes stop_codon:yes gene_type:complete